MAIVRKDILLSGYHGNLESVIIEKDGVAVKSTNGVFTHLGSYLNGQRETRHGELAKDASKEVVFIHNSEVMYDERQQKLEDFEIRAGKVARGYRLNDGDVLTFTTDLLPEGVAVGDVLVAKNAGLLAEATEGEADTAKVVFTVVEDSGFELHQTMKAFAVEITRN
jgi:pSer/pThr/pTyr-binding forkhead associated (FHA) protein